MPKWLHYARIIEAIFLFVAMARLLDQIGHFLLRRSNPSSYILAFKFTGVHIWK